MGREPICCDLESTVARSLPQAFNKHVRARLVALANSTVENQLGIAFNRDERVAVAKTGIVFCCACLLFCIR